MMIFRMKTQIVFLLVLLYTEDVFGMTRAQLKKTLTIMKKQCMPKAGVTEDKVKNIEQGEFIEDRKVMCYIACVYKTIQVVKNEKIDRDLVFKQVDILYPADMKAAVKNAVEQCYGVQEVGDIDQGKFIEERNVMCYIACIYTMGQTIKNNKIVHDAIIKQIDMMFPPEMKEPVKATIEQCRGVAKKYKDICEASYWTAKCLYEADPANFVFA